MVSQVTMDFWEIVMMIVLTIAIVIASIVFYYGSKSSETKFNFLEAFVNAEGKTSFPRIAQAVALVISSWGFIHITVNKDMTEYYFTIYMTAWVLNSMGNKLIDKVKPIAKVEETK